MKRSTKRMISILVCLAMALAILPVTAFAAGTTKVYCQAPDSWSNCYIHYWGGAETTWPGVTMSQDAEGIWYFEVPNEATGLLFHNYSGTQTADLTLPTNEQVMYVFENMYWTEYGKVPVVIDYYVAGVAALCGVDWNPGAPENKMTENADGTYSMTYTGIAAGSYELKVTTGSWATCWGEAGTAANYTVTVDEDDSTVVISFDPATELVSAAVNPVVITEETLVAEGTVTYATDLDAWDAEGVTFIPAQDGTVTVDIIACNPGFYLDVYQDDEWIEEYYDSGAQKISISVSAGSVYEFLFSSAEVFSPTMFEMRAGSVSYKVTADVPAGEPGPDNEDPDVGGETSEENPQLIGSYYGNYIAAGQTMWFAYDNYQHMIDDGVYSQMLYISAGVPYAVSYRGEDVPVDVEGFVSYEMMDLVYQGTYVFSVTNNSSVEAFFTIEVKDRPAYTVSGNTLVLGDNVVLPDLEFTNTLYEFAPVETGVYTFTISEGLIGNWGTVFNPQDNTGTNATVLQWTCTAEGQSVLIGVTQTEEAVLTVEKTGDYIVQDELPMTVYVNTYGFDYQLPQNPELVAIDVLDNKTDVAVLKDGFYRYGSQYGPLMVADLSQFPINLEDAYINGQLRAYVYNESDELIARIDYNDAMLEYLEAGLVPVTEELAIMLKHVGDHHLWWEPNGFVFKGDAPADKSTAWMVACSYIKGSELTPDEDDGDQGSTGNQGGSGTEENPKTTDISVAWAMIAMVAASTCLVVLKKKEHSFLN